MELSERIVVVLFMAHPVRAQPRWARSEGDCRVQGLDLEDPDSQSNAYSPQI